MADKTEFIKIVPVMRKMAQGLVVMEPRWPSVMR